MTAFLGIDIGGTWIKHGAIDETGSILYADRSPTPRTGDQTAALDSIVETARRLIAWAVRAGHHPVAIGIGSPGTIDASDHTVQPPTPHFTAIIGANLAQVVQSATGLPAIVENDANCAAWAEHRFGAGRGIDNLMCVTVGSGIGSGFIVDGRIFSGTHGWGGELGHVTIDWQGPLCPCGNRGCLELYVSAGMLTAAVFSSAHAGDEESRRILDTAARQLAFGALNGIQLFDPEAVILGGGVFDADAAHGGSLLAMVAEQIRRHAFSSSGRRLAIGRAALGNDAGFVGAAALAATLAAAHRESG